MTLYELTNTIEKIADAQPNINSIVKSGDIYDLNKSEYEQEYSAFCATQRTHRFDDETVTYNFVFYYVDRLTLDESNKIDIQSTACNVLMNIVLGLEDAGVLSVSYGDITTFTARFTSLCAGAYLNIGITVSRDLCYEDPVYEDVPTDKNID